MTREPRGMNRFFFSLLWLCAWVAGGLAITGGVHVAVAQPETGMICVSTFADTNGDGFHNSGELPLAGVNVNLSTGGAIIATHVMADAEEQHCFENLLPGIYTVTFTDSPLYRTTTANEGTFALDAGQRLTIDSFGAFPVGPEGLRDEVASQVSAANRDEPIDTSTRVLLAMGGAMGVMLFMIGVGTVVLAFMAWRRKPSRPARPTVPVPPPPPSRMRPPEA